MPLDSDRARCSHLLRRFGLGASEAEVAYYLSDGFSGAIDKLLNYESVDEGFPVTIEDFANPKNGNVPINGIVTWWAMRMIMTRRPLQERMTLFWHNHFATSAEKVQAPLLMHAQNEILRRNATGSFRTLLSEVSKDPAMILWLDNQQNVKGHANENFAREVMELFTLGIGNYTEKDVQEGARAFTGWTFERVRGAGRKTPPVFTFRENRHDDAPKTFLGNTGNFNGDDILNILCDRPRTAEFLVRKIWEWFCYPNPDPALVSRFAEGFRAKNLDIKSLLRDIMTSREFYSPKAERACVKNPVDFCIASLRQLGVGEQMRDAIAASSDLFPRASAIPANAAASAMKSMGMWLLYPPDVSGWKPGGYWITSATMVERIAWGEHLFGQGKAGRFTMRYPAAGLLEATPTSKGVVQKLISVFDAPVRPERIPILTRAAEKACQGMINAENANATAASVTHLIFATPEFHFA